MIGLKPNKPGKSPARSTNKNKVTVGSGNVFADLGFSNPEGELTKGKLVIQLREAIESRGLTQSAAARQLGISRPTLSRTLRGDVYGVSVERIINLLARLGMNVEFVVTDPRGKVSRTKVSPG